MQRFVCGENAYYNDKIYIMGILNVTPDSFSDGGAFFAAENAVRQALAMQEAGADFIDIGAVSTRPGASFVAEQDETGRLLPVLRALHGKIHIPISVDTFRPAVAELALRHGAVIVNDVGGFSPEMAKVICEYNAGWIAVHTVGKAGTEMEYPNGVAVAVQNFFDSFYQKATAAGVAGEQIVFDPGFGFSKNTKQNVELLENLDCLQTHGSFLMTASSRKRFVGELTNTLNPADRLSGTLQMDARAVEKGSCILRVHDVAAHKQMLSERK